MNPLLLLSAGIAALIVVKKPATAATPAAPTANGGATPLAPTAPIYVPGSNTPIEWNGLQYYGFAPPIGAIQTSPGHWTVPARVYQQLDSDAPPYTAPAYHLTLAPNGSLYSDQGKT